MDKEENFEKLDQCQNPEKIEKVKHKGVQLWEGGPFWAECNIGAENPWDVGYYFWWGDIIGYKWIDHKWVASDGSQSDFSFDEEHCPSYEVEEYYFLDKVWPVPEEYYFVPDFDPAVQCWGEGWRMPTEEDFNDLIKNTTAEWTTIRGVPGKLVRGKGAYSSVSIFFPAAGCGHLRNLEDFGSYGEYWSLTPDPYDTDARIFTCSLHIDSEEFFMERYNRVCGLSVRPVLVITE